ncbi:hypothetical protein JTB14_001935 [Gonioctena quinquepunctata]|nr:hypothetical protein JTB14_001935 [Gonioctena quinquepunctata]
MEEQGTVEVRAEIERLQAANSSLQKVNMKLEAENLDMKLDLEQSTKELPHLQQQIQHLENYIDVLKAERNKQEVDKNITSTSDPDAQKVTELERTVFILKRVVEKLQVENKRLVSGKRPLSDRSASADKLKRDNLRLKEKYTECIQKYGKLEQELSVARNKLRNSSESLKSEDDKLLAISEELSKVRGQLEQKSTLLEKVKILLHRAAAKEKALLQEIAELKNKKTAGISPIPEESEGSSSSDL